MVPSVLRPHTEAQAMGSGRGTSFSSARGASKETRTLAAGDAGRMRGSEQIVSSTGRDSATGASLGPGSLGSLDASSVAGGGVAGVPKRHLRVRSIGGARDGPSSTDSSIGGDLSQRPRHRIRDSGSRDSIGGDSALSEDTHTVRHGFYLPPAPSLPTRWTRGDGLGAGSFGSVYLGLNADTGELFAVKEVEVNELDHGACEAAQQLEREVQLLTKLQHPNIVRYIGTARDDGETGGGDAGDDGGNGGGRTHTRTRRSLFIFLEYVPGGSIAGLLMRFGPLEVSVIAVYLSQILVGLDYLHSRNVAHRDVKGANILVDTNGRVKLADFGAAKTLVAKVTSLQKERDVSFHEYGDKLGGEEHGTEGDTHTTQKISGNTNSKHDAENNTASASAMAGSAYWMAPEVVRRSGSGTPADVWSVGCVLIEMATGNHPWFGCGGQAQAIYKIAGTNELPGFPNTFCVSGRDFMFMCLRRSPGERPSAAELLTHPFVADAGGSLGKHGSVPALRYEYADPEDWVGGGDELHGETVTRGEELTDRELALPDALESVPRDAYHLQKDQLVGTADLKNFRRELPASQSGSTATAPAKETTRNHEEPLPDWRVEVEAMRLRFADDDDDTDEVGDPGGWVRGTKEGGGSRPPETRKPASAMPRPPTLAGVG